MSLDRTCLAAAVAVLIVAFAVGGGRCEIPKKVNYQARLVNAAGEALPGQHNVVFRIFDSEAGGTELWMETQSIQADSAGIFSAVLGSVDSVDAGFDGARWLEIEVDGEILSPRREMVSVPFAFQAANSHMVAGLHADAFADSAHAHHSLDALDGDPQNALFVDDEGSVGIGTEMPEAKLDVAGTARMTGFEMPTGAATGQVLTSDAAGAGTWQPPQATSDGDWVIAGSNMYSAVPGGVGIGTTNPGDPLHVRRDQNGQTSITIENRDTGSGSGERLSFTDENGSLAGIATRDNDAAFPNGMVIFNNRPGGGIGFQTGGGTEVARIMGGKVGIRALTPQAYLHVRGEAAPAFTVPAATHVLIEDEYGPGLNFISSSTGTQGILFGDPEDTDIGSIKYSHSDNSLTLRTGAVDRMRIAGDGRVGIGTNTPLRKLHIYENSNGALAYPLKIENYGSLNGTATGILFKVDGGTEDRGKGAVVYERTDTWNRGDFHILQRTVVDDWGPATLADAVVTVKNDGKVGLGTKTPAARLEVGGGDLYAIHTDGRVGIGTETPVASLDIDSPGPYAFHTNDMVGIGTAAPWAHLTVVDSGGTTGAIVALNKKVADGVGGQFVGNNQGQWTDMNGCGLAATGNKWGLLAVSAKTTLEAGAVHGVFVNGSTVTAHARLCYRSEAGTLYKVHGDGASATVMSTSAGKRTLVCPESPEAWFEDYGNGEIRSGACHVELDPLFLDCITVSEEHPLKVFVQLTSPLEQQYYVKKGQTGFDVVVTGSGADAASATFDYKVVGKWRGYEKVRFERAPESVEVMQVSSTDDE